MEKIINVQIYLSCNKISYNFRSIPFDTLNSSLAPHHRLNLQRRYLLRSNWFGSNYLSCDWLWLCKCVCWLYLSLFLLLPIIKFILNTSRIEMAWSVYSFGLLQQVNELSIFYSVSLFLEGRPRDLTCYRKIFITL